MREKTRLRGGRESEKEIERGREGGRDGETERQRDRETEREGGREGGRDEESERNERMLKCSSRRCTNYGPSTLFNLVCPDLKSSPARNVPDRLASSTKPGTRL